MLLSFSLCLAHGCIRGADSGPRQHAGALAKRSANTCLGSLQADVSHTHLAALSVPIKRHISIPTSPLGWQPVTPQSTHAFRQGSRPNASA